MEIAKVESSDPLNQFQRMMSNLDEIRQNTKLKQIEIQSAVNEKWDLISKSASRIMDDCSVLSNNQSVLDKT